MTNQTFKAAILAIALALSRQRAVTSSGGVRVRPPLHYRALHLDTSNQLVARINGSDFDVINIRWSRPGRDGNQTEHAGKNAAFVVLKEESPRG